MFLAWLLSRFFKAFLVLFFLSHRLIVCVCCKESGSRDRSQFFFKGMQHVVYGRRWKRLDVVEKVQQPIRFGQALIRRPRFRGRGCFWMDVGSKACCVDYSTRCSTIA
ncbi:unnamed protein product [Ectocarpus sp. 12 AP-2014]